jgi:CheY-like chemotaxis protein
MTTIDQFQELVRAVLAHLYDPNYLRQSPLVALLGLTGQSNPPLALQRTLIEAITALEPPPDVPSHARSWRTYELLFYRYVQQLTAQEVAEQMSLSERQVRRTQQEAIELLASRLWQQHGLKEDTALVDASNAAGGQRWESPAIEEELAWLREAAVEQPIDLATALAAVLQLVGPMAVRSGTQLESPAAVQSLELLVHPVALNQMLLSLIRLAIWWAPGGRVVISYGGAKQSEIVIWAKAGGSQRVALSANDHANLSMAQKLAELSVGQLTYRMEDRVFTATLALPVSQRVMVMAIDDNTDALLLFQRYCAGTRYHLVGISDPNQVFDLASKLPYRIIVLDVMMPQIDGWNLLGRLRTHPLTSGLPIIVCTILAEQELALSLGASDFLRKPVGQQDFMAALDRQTVLAAPRPWDAAQESH